MKLSALILIKNEQDNIEECLKQLDFADELIVLDQKSQDDSAKIAKRFATQVFSSSSPEFDVNRNILKDKANGEWLLYTDADERISSELKSEIIDATQNGNNSAYYIPRKNFVLGKWLKHGGWWPDYVPKLFKKDALLKWEGKVHESPAVKGEFGYLNSPILHYTAKDLSTMLTKSIKWASVEASLYNKAGARSVGSMKIVKRMVTEFINRYAVKLGFLDGTIGLIQSIFQALHQAIIFVYLWEIQHKTKNKPED